MTFRPRCLALTLILATSLPAFAQAQSSAPVTDLLADALASSLRGDGRWAYVQEVVTRNRKEEVVAREVTRVDPSLPWDTRVTLLETDDGPATEKDQARFQAKRLKDFRKSERSGTSQRPRLRDHLDLAAATVLADNKSEVTFRVPLQADADIGLPPEKLEITIVVGRRDRELHAVSARSTGSFRKAGVAKIKQVNFTMRYRLDPTGEHPSVPANISAGGQASVLFIPFKSTTEVTRRDFRWVTPYDDRFDVEIGESSAVDF